MAGSIGYINGLANKLYFKDDLSIPLLAVGLSDLLYGLLYYICHYLLRGRFDVFFYIIHIMIPEMLYTVAVGIIISIHSRRYHYPKEIRVIKEREVAIVC